MNLLHLFEFIILKMDEPRFMVLETALLNPFELEIIGDSLNVGGAIIVENQCDEKLGDIVTLIGIVADGGKAVELLSIFVIEDLRVLFCIIGKIICKVVDIQVVHIVNVELVHQQPLFWDNPSEMGQLIGLQCLADAFAEKLGVVEAGNDHILFGV